MSWTLVHGFFPGLLRAYNMVRVIEGRILYRNELKENKNYFELTRVRVTEGKITVNVRRKSREIDFGSS